MSKNYMNDSQASDIVKYISDTMKLPVMGAGGGFAPIGTINFFDASVAPQGWLACDGTVYNIADYPDLATYYASVHGASNFYGGNGTTTFAVPNLQGEFLRGAGTNGHTNQGNGGSVGEHQDATEIPNLLFDENYINQPGQTSKVITSQNKDSSIPTTDPMTQNRWTQVALGTNDYHQDCHLYTSRPTNTSFLICVKATVSGDANAHQYSTEEQIWGQDENGNIIYEKTVTLTSSNFTQEYNEVSHGINNIGELIEIFGSVYRADNNRQPLPKVHPSSNWILGIGDITPTTFTIAKGGGYTGNYALVRGRVTLRYTKSV